MHRNMCIYVYTYMSVYRIRLWKSFFSFFFFLSAINTNQNEKKENKKQEHSIDPF